MGEEGRAGEREEEMGEGSKGEVEEEEEEETLWKLGTWRCMPFIPVPLLEVSCRPDLEFPSCQSEERRCSFTESSVSTSQAGSLRPLKSLVSLGRLWFLTDTSSRLVPVIREPLQSQPPSLHGAVHTQLPWRFSPFQLPLGPCRAACRADALSARPRPPLQLLLGHSPLCCPGALALLPTSSSCPSPCSQSPKPGFPLMSLRGKLGPHVL